ncbi:hypothetical protein Dsin_011463 [Dipteronia sinensis]|uniref:Uncharacterized protein n=1 Tax=Dipteronia sinensis TaxID=43782 RepID=A0AAE0EDJ3_9ROSI|nr:hypothetical protein Dsin_011463 [Dipteronia sinensis]
MAGKFVLQSVQVHSRSISLPARLMHLSSLNIIEAEFDKLRTREQYSSSSGGESVGSGLIRLAELYNSINEDVITSPCIQRALHKQQHMKLVEEALDRSVELLDACGNARDLILNIKDQLQELQSALRRRVVGVGGDYSSMECKIHAYTSFRKKLKKDIAKCLRELKRIDNNIINIDRSFNSNMVADLEHEQLVVVLRESSALTVYIFRSILSFLSMPDQMKTKAGGGGWSLIRKLIPAAASERSQEIFNEVGSVDIALHCLHQQIRKSDAKIDVQIALMRLKKLDVCIRDVESGLDCLFRRLIQNRVSLLNILTP